MNVRQIVKEAISQELEIPIGDIDDGTKLSDLDCDSLEYLCIEHRIEDALSLSPLYQQPTEKLVKTVSDLIRHFEERIVTA